MLEQKRRFVQGVDLKPVLATHTLFSDAGGTSTFVPWGLDRPISLPRNEAQHVLANNTVMIATDNSSVVSYIIKKGVHTCQHFVWKYGIPYCVDIKG